MKERSLAGRASLPGWVALALLALPLWNCDGFPKEAPPELTAVAPAQARSGETVVVQGSGFSNTLQENVVLFGNKGGRVVTAAPTELRVEVPTLGLSEDSAARVVVRVQVGGRASNTLVVDILPSLPEMADGSDGETDAGADAQTSEELADVEVTEWEVPAREAAVRSRSAQRAPGAAEAQKPAATADAETEPAASPQSPRAAQSASATELPEIAKPPARVASAEKRPAPKPAAPVPTPEPTAALPEPEPPAVLDGAFSVGATRLITRDSGGGPAGFDGAEVEVMDEGNGARFEVEISPKHIQPGSPYRVRVSLTNLGAKKIKVQRLRATTLVNGEESSKTLSLRSKEIAQSETVFLADLPGVWPTDISSWSLDLWANARDAQYAVSVQWR
jgi:hypothetical protein